MKPGLSKREKIMLFSAGVIVVLYVSIQFVILPLSTRYNEALNERERLSSEKSAHDMEAASLPSLRERSTDTQAKFKELTDGYPVIIPNDEIDNLLTSLVNTNNLRPTSLRIAPITAPSTPPVQDIEYDEDGNPIEAEEVPPIPEFIKVTVQVSVTGSYQSLLRLIDEVADIKYIHLSNVGFTQNRQDNMGELSTISLTFELTFLSE